MAKGILLDTCIVIDYLNGVEPARKYLQANRGRLCYTQVTLAETVAGARSSAELDELLDLFRSMESIELTPKMFLTAGLIRNRFKLLPATSLRKVRKGIKLPDALQAAAAVEHGVRLATRNSRDFPLTLPWVEVPYGTS